MSALNVFSVLTFLGDGKGIQPVTGRHGLGWERHLTCDKKGIQPVTGKHMAWDRKDIRFVTGRHMACDRRDIHPVTRRASSL